MCSSTPSFETSLRLERLRIVEHLAVAVAEDVGRVPALEAEQARLEAGREDRLHQGLAGLEVLAGDRHAVLLARSSMQRRRVDGQVGRAVGVGHAALERRVRVDLRRRDLRIARPRRPFSNVASDACTAPGCGRPRSSRTTPSTRRSQSFVFLKRLMSSISCSARSIFDLPFLTCVAGQLLDVRLLEHRRHRLDRSTGSP